MRIRAREVAFLPPGFCSDLLVILFEIKNQKKKKIIKAIETRDTRDGLMQLKKKKKGTK